MLGSDVPDMFDASKQASYAYFDYLLVRGVSASMFRMLFDSKEPAPNDPFLVFPTKFKAAEAFSSR